MNKQTKFYDGTKLLSLTDINGKKPEIYICTSNRSAGKTTYFSRMFVNRFKKHGEKFALLYRFNYELDNCADKFFTDIRTLFFPNDEMTSEKFARGMYHVLYLNGEKCGYAIALNNADQIKKYSHFFSDVERLLFDEFQSETNHYCNDELTKFKSIHVSLARGNGEQSRYLPVYMVSNPVSLINPYYTELGISYRLNNNTRFLRGNGFVLEQGFNESASNAQRESAFNSAFADSKYSEYNIQGVYLNDSLAFIERPTGKSRYLCTLKYNGRSFGVRSFPDSGVIYCDNSPDETYPIKFALTTDDHNVNYVMIKQNQFLIDTFKYYFDNGCFRFKDLLCKEVIFAVISYL